MEFNTEKIEDKLRQLTQDSSPPCAIYLSINLWHAMTGFWTVQRYQSDANGVFVWYMATQVRPPKPTTQAIALTDEDFQAGGGGDR